MTRGRVSVALALGVACLLAFPARAEPDLVERPEVNLLYTGNTGGVRHAAFSAPTIALLAQQTRSRGAKSVVEAVGPGVLVLGGALLLEPRALRRRPLLRFLAQPAGQTRVLAEHLAALESEHDLIFQYPLSAELDLLSLVEAENRRTRADPTLHRIALRLLEHQTRAGERVLRLEREGEPRAPGAEPLAWEWLRGARGTVRLSAQAATFYSVQKALGGGARRVRLVEEMQRSVPLGTAVLVSGGNEVSTVDPLHPDRTSPGRGLDFAALARLGYAAIVPGSRELYFGLDELREQLKRAPLPLVATNLRRKKAARSLAAAPFPRYLVLRVGAATVGVLGLVDPALGETVRDPMLVAELVVTEAASAVQAALADMSAALGRAPDLVVVVSALPRQAASDFASRAQGVDVLIEGFDESGLHAADLIVAPGSRLRDLAAERRPLLRVHASARRVGHVHAELLREGDTLTVARLTDHQVGVLAELPQDQVLAQQLAAQAQHDGDDEDLALVPPLSAFARERRASAKREEPPGGMFAPRDWSQVIANLLRATSDAEVAVIRAPPATSGDILREQIERSHLGWVSAEDRLVTCELTGAQLKELAALLGGAALFSGLSVDKQLVTGRALNDSERYRVILAAPLLATSSARRLLAGVKTQEHFRLAGARLTADPHGRSVRLGEVVVAVLRPQRGEGVSFEPHYLDLLQNWRAPEGSALEPRWSFGVEGLTFSFTGYANVPPRAWQYNQSQREARTSTPSNYAALVKGTLFATYDSRAYTWDSRVIEEFVYNVIKGGAPQGGKDIVVKPADDLWLESELVLKRWQLPASPELLRFVPYLIAAYDTEFVNSTNPLTGSSYPHRRDLYASAGLKLPAQKVIKVLRLGGLMRTRFASGAAHVDGGILAATRFEFALGQSLLRLGSRLRYFPHTRRDTVDQLGWILEGFAKLLLPLTRDLSLSLDLDLFAYRPKVVHILDPSTGMPIERGTSLSLIAGLGLTFEHLWKP